MNFSNPFKAVCISVYMFYRFVKNVLEDLTVQNPPNKGAQRHEHKQLSKDTFQSKFLFNLNDINRGNVRVCVCLCVCARDQV